LRYNHGGLLNEIYIQPASCANQEPEECYIYGLSYNKDNQKLYFGQGPSIKSVNLDGTGLQTVYTQIIDSAQTNRRLIIYSLKVDVENDFIFVNGYPDGLDLSGRCYYRLPLYPTAPPVSVTIASDDHRFLICYGNGGAQFDFAPGITLNQ